MNSVEHDQSLFDIHENMTLKEENYLIEGWTELPESYICVNGITNTKESFGEIEGNDSFYETLIRCSVAAQSSWEHSNARRDLLYKMSTMLASKKKTFSQLNERRCLQNNWDLFVDYFKFYSDINIDDIGLVANEIALIKMSSKSPMWLLGLNIAAALSAGCSIIIVGNEDCCRCATILVEVSQNLGLPIGVINILPEPYFKESLFSHCDKIIILGDMEESRVASVLDVDISWVTLSRTCAIVLEASDIQGAADVLFSETWNLDRNTVWDVTLVAVQESIFELFLEKMTKKVNAFYNSGMSNLTGHYNTTRLTQAISECKKMGGKVIGFKEDVWGPVLICEYQLDIDRWPDLPIMTILVFRTDEEAVKLVNNSSYCLATSIWTENVSQVFKISSQLESSLVWINCHGVVDASASFEPSRRSGVGCFGGIDGALSFMKMNEVQLEFPRELDNKFMSSAGRRVLETSTATFQKWYLKNDRKTHMKAIVYSLAVADKLKEYSRIVDFWAENCNTCTVQNRVVTQDLFIAQTKKPRGVILLVLYTYGENLLKSFTSLISPAISAGNVVIVYVYPKDSLLDRLVKYFKDNLPNGVLNVVDDYEDVLNFLCDDNIQCVWIHGHHELNESAVAKIIYSSKRNMKRTWVSCGEVGNSKILLESKFLKNQAIYIPKMD